MVAIVAGARMVALHSCGYVARVARDHGMGQHCLGVLKPLIEAGRFHAGHYWLRVGKRRDHAQPVKDAFLGVESASFGRR